MQARQNRCIYRYSFQGVLVGIYYYFYSTYNVFTFIFKNVRKIKKLKT